MAYDELYHHGVKGMKWGVRKYQTKGGTWTSAGKKHLRINATKKKIHEGRKIAVNRARNLTGSSNTNTRKEARKKDINEMSNQELQAAITRMNLERQYRGLTKVGVMKGQQYAANAMKYDGSYNALKKSSYAKAGKKVIEKAAWSFVG